jgi:hypothetical protein
MLIELAEFRHTTSSDATFPAPIVSLRRNDKAPTSADVHMYPDPDTFYESSPLLYADCEGLDAGEAAPMAITRERDRQDSRRHNISGGRIRRLDWAENNDKRGRSYIVQELYPRLLYTFSDVVVFVLRNAK